jgi:hypothetical protein
MTQRTINLYDGLEALYYFDSDYFDGPTGEIKDKSGHGRHATANGGPTVGVNGPNDFEAANFSGDGSGDSFVGEPVPSDSYTLFILFRQESVNDDDRRNYIGNKVSNGGATLYYRGASNKLEGLHTESDGSNQRVAGFPIDANEWYYAYLVYDGTKSKLIVNGIVQDIRQVTYSSSQSNLIIGKEMGGDIAIAGKWSRALSKSERDELDDLTAPRRAQL